MIKPQIDATDVTTLDPALIEDTRTVGGWVSREGKYFRVEEPNSHLQIADLITGTGDGWRPLEAEGWVHLGQNGSPEISDKFRFAHAQSNTLFDIAALFSNHPFGKKLLSYINDA